MASITFTNEVTVSNLNETAANPNCTVGRNSGASQRCAMGFSTGSRSGSYTLQNITARFIGKFGSPGNIVVKLHAADTANSSNPAASSLVTLTGSNPDTAGLYTYTCPAGNTGCNLSANSAYFIVMSTPDTTGNNVAYYWGSTTSDNETEQPTGNGWAIADVARYQIMETLAGRIGPQARRPS